MTTDLELALRRLGDDGEPIRPASLYALSSLRGEQLPTVQMALQDLSGERKREVLGILTEWTESMIDVDFSEFFRLCLRDGDAEVRRLAIEGLWENEELWLVGALLGLLGRDPDARVRAAAASSLGRFVLLGEMGTLDGAVASSAERALLATYFAPDELMDVKRRALEALAYSSEAGVGDLIEAAYFDSDEDLCLSALFAMGRSADRRWRPIVIDELQSESPAARYEAAVACGELELRDAVEPLAQLVADADREVCSAAIEALGKIGGAEAVRVLESCFQSGDEVLLAEAEEALEQASWRGDDDFEVLDDWSLGSSWHHPNPMDAERREL